MTLKNRRFYLFTYNPVTESLQLHATSNTVDKIDNAYRTNAGVFDTAFEWGDWHVVDTRLTVTNRRTLRETEFMLDYFPEFYEHTAPYEDWAALQHNNIGNYN